MKKLFVLGLALVIMCMSLTGCGSEETVSTFTSGKSVTEKHYIDDVLVKEIESYDGVIQYVAEYNETNGYLIKEVIIGSDVDVIKDYDEYGVVTETQHPHVEDNME